MALGRLTFDDGRRWEPSSHQSDHLLPPDWGSKVESALRIFGADRALLLVEGIALAKLIMLGVAQLFRRRRQ